MADELTDLVEKVAADWHISDQMAKGIVTAVLDAIAEPTGAMVEEGAVASAIIQYTNEYKRPITLQDEATTVYRAMIAALRKEVEEDTK